MTLTNSPGNRPIAALAALAMRVAGIIIILSVLLDFLISPWPYQLGERAWQLAFATQLVDRGLVPLVGLALVFAGYWLETSLKDTKSGRSLWQTVRFWAAALACVLGAIYLVMFPLHLNNVRLNNIDLQQRLTQEAQQADTQLQQRISLAVQQQRAQIGQLVSASDEQLQQAVQQKLISEQDASLIRGFKEKPETLDPYLQEQAQKQLTQEQARIKEQQTKAADTARSESLKSGLRVGLNSLLLAIGYIIIGWVGLRLLRQEF
ncbi:MULTISPECIES: HpsJ family protein [unclassified Leptolyngbya]|uniref:hormogonium polysaccharide biosynthesis protein HpsJ n=1 Tax=unclassified Leptolyngbya TaxID=2650499 RepID=UPI001683F5BD|nr:MULTISPECIES: HpsJ family protein [unclassified Leptolyngbya]MBD1911816.1 hypothetical protein [Leptolyngbya sp. FACHB-8]MBD2153294.1 hypothetical protein [Leptolyngbya sp. FACHB-16]